MAQTSRNVVLFVLAWLWFTAACLADKPPSGSIEFTPGSRTQRRHHQKANSQYGASEMVYGPLVPRVHSTPNGSELLGRADPGYPGLDTYGPLVHVPGCFYCPPKDVLALTGRDLLASLTTEKMQTYMRISDKKDLFNKCVFYTSAVRQPPKYLSEKASTWACSKNKLSIWHLWPNKVMADNNPEFRDFYGIDKEDNWLNSIDKLQKEDIDKGVPPTIQYFENMSEAMARSCSGEVVILTQTPDSMHRYSYFPNIWWNKERRALDALRRQGKISRFLVADYDDPTKIWEFDIVDNKIGNRVDESTLLSRDLEQNETEAGRLLQRAVCESSGLAQMPRYGDPFSDDYSLFG